LRGKQRAEILELTYDWALVLRRLKAYVTRIRAQGDGLAFSITDQANSDDLLIRLHLDFRSRIRKRTKIALKEFR
jgi:biopolymer transport protein ExbB/TolQ